MTAAVARAVRTGGEEPDTPESAPADTPPAPLFRREALEARQVQWLGTVLLEPRVSHRAFALTAIATIVCLVAFLVFGSYTRKVRVGGWLVPELGLVTISAQQSGTVRRVNVREGQRVTKGETLFVISGEIRDESGGSTRRRVVENLLGRRESQRAEAGLQGRLFDEQDAAARQRVDALTSQSRLMQQEIELQRNRVRLSEQALGRARQMRARDLVPATRVEQAEQDRIDQATKLNSLERGLSALSQELLLAKSAVRELPLKRETQLGAIDRNVSGLDQELAEAEARSGVAVVAPEDGIVSGIQTEAGSYVAVNAPLLSLVPAGSRLQAQLFASSRSIGFVHAGQKVLLRYQAFPFQKFGAYAGEISEVSRSAVSPSELSHKMTGLTGLYGPNEPVYRIVVDLSRQDVQAYGEAVALRPGMQLDADIMVESRRLFEWMLDPLYTLTGK